MKTQNYQPDYMLKLNSPEYVLLTKHLAAHRRNYVRAVLSFCKSEGKSAESLQEQRKLLEDIEKAVSLCEIQ